VEELHTGNADDVIVRRARECGAQLVVVSSLGTSKAERRLLGSVAERTAESSPATTLVVRSAAPFESWLRGKRPLRVFVAFDFTVTAERAVEWVRDLRMAGPCEVTVGYANQAPEDRERFGVRSRPSEFENPPLVQQALERDVRDKLALLLGSEDAQVSVRARGDGAASVLMDMAKAARADLIVTGTHQRAGLSRLWTHSLSREFLCQAPVSVACVPTPQPRAVS
jgi:nucleotide-binding universal stress UspA family protein